MTESGLRDLDAIPLYRPDPTTCRIDLSDNTNAWGVPPAVTAALAASTLSARYPSPYADDLKRVIAGDTGFPVESIVTGCGSDDVLDCAMRALARPGERVAFPDPTFPMIPAFALLNGLTPVAIPMTPDYQIDPARMLSSDARIIYVCSPSNPTGNALSRASLEALASRSSRDQVIIIDEAYAEFAGCDALDLARSYDRVLVTRTFSKAFGLAGFRVGYALGNPSLVAAIEKSRGPYKVSALGERAAIAALTVGRPWVEDRVRLAMDNRSRFEASLVERGLAPVPSSANFVYLPIAGAMRIASGMRERGVAVRAFPAPEALRFTIGDWPVMLEALAAFDEARRCA